MKGDIMEALLKQLIDGQNKIIERLERVEQRQIRMENDHGTKIGALFDAREVQIDVGERTINTLNRMEGKLDRLTLKVLSHEAELRRVK